jgi:tetratricopeptide (TPR) repeat protein
MISHKTRTVTSRSLWMLSGTAFLFVALGMAQSQKDAVCGGGCGGGCGPCPTSSGAGASGGSGYSRPKQTAAEKKEQKAGELDNSGNAAYAAKNWAMAEADFRQALRIDPNNQSIQRNLAHALVREAEDSYDKYDYASSLKFLQEALTLDPANDPSRPVIISDLKAIEEKVDDTKRDEQRRAQQQIEDKLSAGDMKDALSRMVHTAPTVTESKGIFGTKSNPANPQLDFTAVPPAVVVKSATDQLTSARNSGVAANAADSNEAAAAYANCAFTTDACAKTEAVPIHKGIGQSHGAAALAIHMSEGGRSDAQIKQSMAYYEKLDSLTIETKAKLAAVQQKIDSGNGDTAALSGMKTTLTNDLNRYDADQATTQAQIKKRLLEINLPWNETLTPAADAKAKP